MGTLHTNAIPRLARLIGGFPMPIKIPDALPATDVLEGENIFVMTEYRAIRTSAR